MRVSALILMLFATPAFAQVRVDVRLEQTRYVAGEPIVVVFDLTNVGTEPIGYEGFDRSILTVANASTRVVPNIFSCFSGGGTIINGGVGSTSHPPQLAPGSRISFPYLLRGYQLATGQYTLLVSGKASVRWGALAVRPGPVPPPAHAPGDPVPGAQIERTLQLNVLPATEEELRNAFAPYVTAADGPDLARRHAARMAIVESAPQFLEPLIRRFAREPNAGQLDVEAIDALGRLATAESRADLKQLFQELTGTRPGAIVLALARIGYPADAEFFAGVLEDATRDIQSKRYAALGLGHIGGDEVIRHLERALLTVPPEVRPSIAIALGNTRSRLAVPVLIGMYGNDPARNDVCGALKTLTHRAWCGGTPIDLVSLRRQWLRSWNENASTAPVFGPDSCDEREPARAVPAADPIVDDRAPTLTSLYPLVAMPNATVRVAGVALGMENLFAIRAVFVQGDVERVARIGGGSRPARWAPDGSVISTSEQMEIVVPETLTPGRWQIVVDVRGRRSAPLAIDIVAGSPTGPVELRRATPTRPHPSQLVTLETITPARFGDQVELIDARDRVWRIGTGVSGSQLLFSLPDEVADGEATVRVGRTEDGVDRFGPPLTFVVTSGPLPLKPGAAAMKPVAPGQWTDLLRDIETGFELARADRVDVEFRQGNVAVVSQPTGQYRVHVQVPKGLAPGLVSVRTRTWIEQTPSEWSAPVDFRVLRDAGAPSGISVQGSLSRNLIWPGSLRTRPGEALVLNGHFPVARAADLRVQLRRATETFELSPTEVDGGVRVEVPASATPGEWRLMIGPADGGVPLVEITTLRVM